MKERIFLLVKYTAISTVMFLPFILIGQVDSDPLDPLVSPSVSMSSTAYSVANTFLWILLGVAYLFSIYYFTAGDFSKGIYTFIGSSLLFAIIYAVLNSTFTSISP